MIREKFILLLTVTENFTSRGMRLALARWKWITVWKYKKIKDHHQSQSIHRRKTMLRFTKVKMIYKQVAVTIQSTRAVRTFHDSSLQFSLWIGSTKKRNWRTQRTSKKHELTVVNEIPFSFSVLFYINIKTFCRHRHPSTMTYFVGKVKSLK